MFFFEKKNQKTFGRAVAESLETQGSALGVLVPFLATWLACSYAVGAWATELCPSAANLQIPGVSEKKIVLFGEIHGTEQSPAYFRRLVCTLLTTHPHLLVALEIPRDEQQRIDTFLSSGAQAGANARANLLAGAF
jgi:hypothetical protein